MKRIKTKTALLIAFLSAGWISSKAQVVIGADLPPIKGALLELKDHASINNDLENASKGGLILPRVKLTNRNTLEPLIESTAPEWNVANIGETWRNHIGLTVYNLTENLPDFKQGIYIWTIAGWQQLETASEYIYVPTFNLPWPKDANESNYDIYEEYKKTFRPTAGTPSVSPHYFSSKGTGANALVDITDFAQAEDFYYIVTDYSKSGLSSLSITDKGKLTYKKTDVQKRVPPENAYLNIIMIRK